MMKIYYILQGWINHILFKMGLKDKLVWNKRKTICNSCSINNDGMCSKRRHEIIEGKKTFGCGCPISKKIKSSKPCPLGKWK
jgi:hypothetical protein